MDAIELTKQLVAIPSPSHESNRAVSECMRELLRSLGFDVEWTSYVSEQGQEKVNLVGRLGPCQTESPGLAYFCHSDVVPADLWTGPGEAFCATELEGRIYGRGTCDMKGSAACMLSAIAQLDSEAFAAPCYFVCTADEEIGYLGAKHVVNSSARFREIVQRQALALIGEPTELRVVYAHKGICAIRAISSGEAAHSATREGCNANLAMIPFLQEMKAIYDETESQPRWQNAEFDPPTVSWNIGINDHTQAINVKPPQSVCTVFYRPLPGVDDQQLIARVEAAAQRHGLSVSYSRSEPVYTPRDAPLVQQALEITSQATATTVAYGTDAGEFGELAQKIVCGPGSIAQAHTTDEWIARDQLIAGTALYKRFVQRWCLAPGSDR